MADRPILFSAPMVRALIAGTKTQTRRIMKPQPFESGYYDGEIELAVIPADDQWPKAFRFNASAVGGDAILGEIFEPRINEGDRLYVREHWRVAEGYDGHSPAKSHKGKPVLPTFATIAYEADTPLPEGVGKHRQGMHMPRWASRLTLTVTDVRVERLQNCSVEDACAEGALVPPYSQQFADVHALSMYRAIWNGINGDGAWEANPWVVAYTFTVDRRNIDEIGRAAA